MYKDVPAMYRLDECHYSILSVRMWKRDKNSPKTILIVNRVGVGSIGMGLEPKDVHTCPKLG